MQLLKIILKYTCLPGAHVANGNQVLLELVLPCIPCASVCLKTITNIPYCYNGLSNLLVT